MENQVLYLKRRIREKLERIEDADYLESLDAILAYETAPAQETELPREELSKAWRRTWLRLWHHH
jgi:ubiquinone biosynthesis protein COQ9